MRFGSAVLPLQQFINSLPNIIAALITFTLGAILAQFIGRTISGALSGIGLEIHDTLGSVAQGLVMTMVFIISLQQIGMDVDLLTQIFTSTLIIIIAGVALAFGLGGRSITRNVLAGYYAREMFTPGDIVDIDGEQGILEGIGTLNTEIRLAESILTVPNIRLTEGNVKRSSN
jgi:small-conductance mechanosensitive channel